MRVKGKEHVDFFKHPLEMPSLQEFLTPFTMNVGTDRDVKAVKLRCLRDEASLYAYICS